MKTATGRVSFMVALIGVLFLGLVPQIRADVFDDANDAIKECEKATKDAQDLNPMKSIRDAENKLDQAEQKLDEVNSKTNPKATDEEKQNAKDARDSAKEDADAAQKAGNQQNKGKYEKYRDALERRRDACKKLKKLIPDMQTKIGQQAKTINEEIVSANKKTLQKARECVKKCGEPPTVAMVMPGVTPDGGTFAALPSGGGGGNISFTEENPCLLITDYKISVDITGTGETIGHVADARITNLTDEPIEFTIPPGVLESRSRKNQDYGHLKPVDVVLQPHESKVIPLDGICLDRHKPPVENGVGGDLAFNDCDPDRKISQDDSDRMLEISESVDQAADDLEKNGELKEMPYKDPKKRKDIVKQWGTWVRMSEVTGDPPPTKDDLKKVVEKQVGKVPPDQQKKIDKGIDTIFEKVELTTKKAKDIEKENENDEGANENAPGANTYEISDNTPTPQPGTQEKKKKEGKKKKDKKKKYPPEIQKWLDDYDAWIEWASKRNMAEFNYLVALRKWALEHSPHYKELNDAVKKAADEINDASKNGKPTQEEWDNLKKAQQELEKSEKELGKDFQKTEPGKVLYKEFIDAEDIANKAKARADESGKGIDPDLKKGILEKERD